MTESFAEKVYTAVKRIPRGRVASYSDIALLAGHPGAQQAVGQALTKLDDLEEDIPWWRVVRATGEPMPISPIDDMIRKLRLETEGVRPSPDSGKICLEQYGCLLPRSPRRGRGGSTGGG